MTARALVSRYALAVAGLWLLQEATGWFEALWAWELMFAVGIALSGPALGLAVNEWVADGR